MKSYRSDYNIASGAAERHDVSGQVFALDGIGGNVIGEYGADRSMTPVQSAETSNDFGLDM